MSLPVENVDEFLGSISDDDAHQLLYDWRNLLARPEQIAPPGDWEVWMILSGRGWGKTRTGAEFVREEVTAGRAERIALVAETAADVRDVMVEGPSGIMNVFRRKNSQNTNHLTGV